MATNSRAPISRWDATEAKGPYTSAAYGAFVVYDAFMSDTAAFGISKTEARGLDPIAGLILQTSYAMFLESLPSCKHPRGLLTQAPIGFFLGAGGSTSSQGGSSEASSASAPLVYAGTS